jgi:hypothetical protein
MGQQVFQWTRRMDQGYLRTRVGCQERDHDQSRKERSPQESSQKLYAIHFNSDESTFKRSLPGRA